MNGTQLKFSRPGAIPTWIRTLTMKMGSYYPEDRPTISEILKEFEDRLDIHPKPGSEEESYTPTEVVTPE